MAPRRVVVGLALLALAHAGCATGAGPAPDAGARAALERGRALVARGDMAGAASALREALRRDPDAGDARAALGLALYAMGDLDAAVEELRAALARRPDDASARLTLAAALVARRDWAGARRELERLLAAEPDRLQAHYTLGVVRYAEGDVEGAADAFRRVVAGDPESQDARYNLALMLKLLGREADATAEFVIAARAGHARAQYFAGAAYAGGLGVERDLAVAVAWWFRAAEQGVGEAEEALADLRQAALGHGPRAPADGAVAARAFRDYRASLWKEFPGLAADGDDTVGGALLRRGRAREAVPVLIREASALSEPALRLLEALYRDGVEGQVPAHDARILGFLDRADAEGLRPTAR